MTRATREIEVIRTYLELQEKSWLKPSRLDDPLLTLERAVPCTVALCQELYRDAGNDWHWVDRWKWSEEEWDRYVRQPGFSIWVLKAGATIAGFFELHPDEGAADSVEVALFGLMPGCYGRGLGRHLLTAAVEAAWGEGATRVWLHTCTLDSPAALPNYLARGFRPFKTETYKTLV